ncbi:MAG: hypothetical protein M3Y31_05380 [Gemmatimonadota bacterium]|nr:hypothetical protein [Gemmatimonadota bacterium]
MRVAALVSIALAAACGGTSAEPTVTSPAPGMRVAAPATAGRFVLLQGGRPIATEEFERTAGGFVVDMIPSGGQPGLSYRARVTPDGLIDSLDIAMQAPPGGAAQRLLMMLESSGDTAVVHHVQWRGDSAVRRTVGTRAGAVFYINPSPSMMEQIVRRARLMGGDSVDVPIFMPIGEGRTAMVAVTFPTQDSAVTSVGGVAVRMGIDSEGRMRGAVVPTQGLVIERQDAAR